jgi:hypothetical protein
MSTTPDERRPSAPRIGDLNAYAVPAPKAMIKLMVVSAFGVIPDLPSDFPIGCIIAWYLARILPSNLSRANKHSSLN